MYWFTGAARFKTAVLMEQSVPATDAITWDRTYVRLGYTGALTLQELWVQERAWADPDGTDFEHQQKRSEPTDPSVAKYLFHIPLGYPALSDKIRFRFPDDDWDGALGNFRTASYWSDAEVEDEGLFA
jgi:hypothetical protein